MPSKRKAVIGRKTVAAKKLKLSRISETQDEHEIHLAADRLHYHTSTVCESNLEKKRLKMQQTRAMETQKVRQNRLKNVRSKMQETRATETSTVHEKRLNSARVNVREIRANLWSDLNLEGFNYKKEIDYR